MPKHSGLGKGLDALIPTHFQSETPQDGDTAQFSSGYLSIPSEQIVPNPRQPRAQFEETALAELAASIQEHSCLRPRARYRVS